MRETRISIPTFRHTTFVSDGVENGYDEATTNVKGRTWDVASRKRF